MSGRPKNTAGRFVVNAASSVLTVLISMTALLWVNQYLLRRISPDEYALIPVLTSLIIFAEFFRIIFTRGLSRFMVEADARDDHEEVSRIVSSMLPVLSFVGLVIGGLGAVAVWQIDNVVRVEPEYRGDAQIMFALLVLALCLSIATTPLCAGLFVRMRFVELNLVNLGAEVLRVGILLVLLVGIEPRALYVVIASSTANITRFAVLMAVTYLILPSARFRTRLVSWSTVKRLLSFSLWTSVQGLNMFVQRAAPALLLNRYAGGIDVAAFHLGNLPNTQIRKLTQAAAGPATPALTTIYATEGAAALTSFYYRGGRYHLWGTLLPVGPLIVFAEPLIQLYVGDTYLAAAGVIVVLMLIYPAVWSSAMFYQIAYAIGRIRAYNICSIALAISAFAAMYYFVAIEEMGAIGAAYGMAAGFIGAQVVIIWPMGLRLVKGRWDMFFRLVLLTGLAPFVAATVVAWVFAQLVDITTWTALIGGSALSALVYLAVILAVCLDPTDRDLLRGFVGKLRRRISRS